MNPGSALVFLAKFFNEAAIYQILQFLVGPEAEHFLATTHCVTLLQVLEHSFKKIVEPEHFLFRKNVAKLIGHVVWKSPGKPGSFCGCCHSGMILPLPLQKATQIFNH